MEPDEMFKTWVECGHTVRLRITLLRDMPGVSFKGNNEHVLACGDCVTLSDEAGALLEITVNHEGSSWP